MDKNRYPIGHKKYGEMGPMTQKEAMNMPMANRTIHKLTKYGEILKSNSPKKPSTSDSLQVHMGRKHPEWAQDAKKIENKFGKLNLSNFNAKKALKRLGY